jgi:GWxTD domain-containing protein
VGEEDRAPDATEQLPRLIDPSTTYREMGLLADPGPLGFVGSTRVFAGAQPDSLRLIVGLSLQSRGLAFRRDGDGFLAEYRVEIALRGTHTVQSVRNERIRVATFRETQRTDESVIFQDIIGIAPGTYSLSVSVRDRNGPNGGRVEQRVVVPALSPPSLSLPVAIYSATPRATLDAAPAIVMNPRQSAQYGSDTLRFYLETYGLAPGRRIVAAAVGASGRAEWTDTIAVSAAGPVAVHLLTILPNALSIGRYELRLQRGDSVLGATPFVVTFSDQYAIANVEDIVSLLRYFPGVDSLRAVLRLPAEERGAAWQRFWRASDNSPATPENEAIDEYLARVRVANDRFRDEGTPGWLTDRGEVFIRLGEPDNVMDQRPEQTRGRIIIWSYQEHRLSLSFVDDAGFGNFRLSPGSRADFIRVVNRLSGR